MFDEFEYIGYIPSKNNRNNIGRGRVYPSKEFVAFKKIVQWQYKICHPYKLPTFPRKSKLRLYCTIWKKAHKGDLDGHLATIKDVLQKFAYYDDGQIIEYGPMEIMKGHSFEGFQIRIEEI